MRMLAGRAAFLTVLTTFVFSSAASDVVLAQEQPRPTFRSGVAVVPITATVRDAKKRTVINLEREDFQVLEQGQPRRIVQFSADNEGAVSVAFLFDTSGSMGLASNLAKGREVVAQLLYRMQSTRDEAALFTFHRTLREEVPFSNDLHRVQRALDGVRPWGLTSIYDAVAETAKRLAKREAVRRALVVITDGVDTSSALTSREVAALASAIDVPIYIVAVVSPLDHPSHGAAVVPETVGGGLADLANLTGGDVVYVSAFNPAAPMEALLATMRHQYFLAIESSASPGSYPLEVTIRQKGLTVRARRAYVAGSSAGRSPASLTTETGVRPKSPANRDE